MATTFHLPCPKCHHQTVIERRHAGQLIECPKCQHSLEVPKLRDFTSLTAIDDGSPQSAPTVANPLRPWFFVLGLGAIVLCGLPGWLLKSHSQRMMQFGEEYTESIAPAYFEGKSQEDLWRSWYEFFEAKRDLPPWQPSMIKLTYDQGVVVQYISYGLMALAGFGLILLLSSFALPNRTVQPRRSAKK